jgi:hypothetical protein
MNAILFYVYPMFKLTGSVLNALEYFIEAHSHNKKVELVLIDGTPKFKKTIAQIAKERYNIGLFNGMSVGKHISIVRKNNLVIHKFDTVLVLDYNTIKYTKGLLNAKKILVISEKYTSHPDYFYSKDLYNVEYYGEMPFHYRDHEYRMKMLFDRYKPLKNVEEGTYINSPKNDMLNLQLLEPYDLPTPFIFKSKTNHKENLFEKFTHYVYYHANKWFDPHPRLMFECKFYDKKLYYINPREIQDGSWYRWKDLQENGLKNRTLSKDDEIIRQLI